MDLRRPRVPAIGVAGTPGACHCPRPAGPGARARRAAAWPDGRAARADGARRAGDVVPDRAGLIMPGLPSVRRSDGDLASYDPRSPSDGRTASEGAHRGLGLEGGEGRRCRRTGPVRREPGSATGRQRTAAARTGRRTSTSPSPAAPGSTAASNVRTGQPRNAAVSSSVCVRTSTPPARSAIRASSSGSNVCRSTTASSAAARDDSSSSACGRAHRSRSARQVGDPGRRRPGQPAQPAGVPVADRRRLAGDDQAATRTQHPQALAQASSTSGTWWITACPTTRSNDAVVVRQVLGVAHPTVDLEAQPTRVVLGRLDHARRQVAHRDLGQDTGLAQVQREEAGAGTDLERPPVRPPVRPSDRDEPVARIADAPLVERDRPLLVVRRGLPVVIEHLGEFGVVPGLFDVLGR